MSSTKSSGLGDRFYVGGYDISGDVNSLSNIHGGNTPLDVTDITQSAHSRLPGLRDGGMEFVTYMDTVAGQEHAALSPLPRTDAIMTYLRGTGIGAPAACLNAKEISYDATRAADGQLTFKTAGVGNSYGLEWGVQLTPGNYTAPNLLTGQNTGFEGGDGNWVAGTNSSVANSSAQAHSGSDSLAVTSTASGDMTAVSAAAASYATEMFAVVPGNAVNVQAWLRSAVSARTCAAGVDWYTSGGSFVSTSYGSGVADTTSGWTLIPATVTAPATAAWGRVNVKIEATGAGSEVHYVDDVEWFLLPASYDTGASLSFGAQAYVQVVAFTGTDATIAIYDSADNVSFSAVSGLGFAQVTSAPQAQRITIGNTSTVRRYIAANVVTAGGFAALEFVVMVNKNPVAGVVF